MCLNKKELRKQFLNKRDEMSKDEVKRRSEIIVKKITNEVDLSKMTALFMSIRNEVDLSVLLNENAVALPKVIGKNMIFCKNTNEFSKGVYGIKEPIGVEVSVSNIIVPGAVFDKNGYRIGYGGGYYDKYMKSSHFKVGVCYDFQVVDKLPIEVHDVKLDMLITDKKIYRW